jgi:hypothetical protein
MTLVGPVVLDIVQHFTERWNEIKKRKVRFTSSYCLAPLADNILFGSTAMKRRETFIHWRNSRLIALFPTENIHGYPSHMM